MKRDIIVAIIILGVSVFFAGCQTSGNSTTAQKNDTQENDTLPPLVQKGDNATTARGNDSLPLRVQKGDINGVIVML